MAHAQTLGDGVNEGDVRGAATAAPRSNPLKLVEAAVAGDDLQAIAHSVAEALRCPVAIALPPFGLWAQWPAETISQETAASISNHATALVADRDARPPAVLTDTVPVRLGHDVVGLVAAVGVNGAGGPAIDPRPWLEAAAAAAAVTALMRESNGSDTHSARRAFLQMLELHAPSDLESVLTQARRLGYDFSAGAVGVGATLAGERRPAELDLAPLAELGLLADVGDDRLLGLVPLGGEAAEQAAEELLAGLRQVGLEPIASSPRRGAVGLPEALHEATLLLELLVDPGAMLIAQEETYRLLVGVLIHNPDELHQLRERTIAELETYDGSHDTDLVATLETFLAHHGSTTDTAEAMSLHRHTVGYRLARVQEVSGLSPYESEGRERLSLGLKAHRIMLAEKRRAGRTGSPAT